MAYTVVPAVTAGDFGRASWATIVKNDLADHETRILAVEASGAGDVVGPSSSVASELALFDGTTGKLIKRATGTGYVKVTSGVMGTPSATVPTTDLSGTIALATQVSGNLPLANLPTNFAQILKATVTLTDAQIKALPTTSITLVAAAGSGTAIEPIWARIKTVTTSGAYTNINSAGNLKIEHAGPPSWPAMAVIPNDTLITNGSTTRLSDLLGTTTSKRAVFLAQQDAEAVDQWGFVPPVLPWSETDNQSLQIRIDNNGGGNLTGGNAANTLTVVVLYMVL